MTADGPRAGNPGDVKGTVSCGMCGDPLPLYLYDVVAIHKESGNFIVGKTPAERAIHRCATMTREDQMEAMHLIASRR